MSALISKASKTYGKKLFEQHLQQYTPPDPLYEYYTDRKGIQRKRRRELPPGLSKRDAAILRSVKKRAHYLDKGFSIFGMRFGWTFFISLIPVVGDVTDAALNYRLVVYKARQADIPPWLLHKMLLNNAVSAAVSFVPIVGDVILAAFKANSRNAQLLEEFLQIRGEEFLKMGGVPEDTTKEGWLKALVNKAMKSGVAPKDAEQIKPGAGMTAEEMRQKEGNGATSAHAVVSASGAAARPSTTTASTVVDPDVAEADTMATVNAKPKKRSPTGNSFGGFFSSSRKRSSPTSDAPRAGDKSRFFENVQ